MKLRFLPLGRTIEFVDCADMASGFRSILRGWTVEDVPAGDYPADVTFRQQEGRYIWSSDVLPAPRGWRKNTPRDPFEAVTDFHYYFLDWIASGHPDRFCIHAGAVEFDAGLVVFPCAQRAGKSTLAVHLAQRGCKLFCDDVLPIDAPAREGVALGLLPRLRLPLPPNITDAFRQFVNVRAGLGGKRHVYVELRPGEIAALGARSKIAAIISLAREDKKRQATLESMPVSMAAKLLIDQNFTEEIPVADIFDGLHATAASVPRLLLRYSELDDASDVLAAELGPLPAGAG